MTSEGRHAARHRAEPTVRRRDRSLVISITGYSLSRDEPVVDVASLGDLFEVAKKYESVVMEHATPERTEYFVWDDGLMYRFSTSGAGTSES